MQSSKLASTCTVSTKYGHKKQRKVTWMILGNTQRSQINKILISKKWRLIQDTKTYRRANVDSGNFLLTTTAKLKISNNRKNIKG